MGIFSYNQKRLQQQYSSDPANFAYGQQKVWTALSPLEKASSLFQEYSQKGVDLAKEVGPAIVKSAVQTGVALGDVAERASPSEFGANIQAGVQNVFTGDKNLSVGERFSQGRTERQARPLRFEQLTGQQLMNPDGSVNWDFARQFVGKAAEGPTYAYSGAMKAGELVGRGLLTRILTRSVKNLPLAGVNTALQAGEQGNTDNLGKNLLTNALLLSGISNIAGELKFPSEVLDQKIADIEKEAGKLTPEQRVDVHDALKQGVKPEEIVGNLQKLKNDAVSPQEVADVMNKHAETIKTETPSAPKTPDEAAPSAMSYVKSNGEKVYTKLTPEEYKALQPEGHGSLIPPTSPELAAQGHSQIHLDPLNSKLETSGAKEMSREDFMAGHPQAAETFSHLPKPTPGPTLSQPKEIIAQTETPVGPTKVTKSAKDINTRLTEKGFDAIPEEDQARYTTAQRKVQVADVTTELSDWEKAQRMALGHEETPKHIDRQILFNAVKNKAESDGNLELMRSLASSPINTERSVLAQKLGAAAVNNNPDSAVSRMTELAQAKEAAVSKRLKSGNVEKARSAMTKTIKTEIKKFTPDNKKWQAFLNEIRCK